MTTHIFGHLEIDSGRGAVYFHSSTGAIEAGFSHTPLRIYGLGEIKFPFGDKQVNITIHPTKEIDGKLLAKVSK